MPSRQQRGHYFSSRKLANLSRNEPCFFICLPSTRLSITQRANVFARAYKSTPSTNRCHNGILITMRRRSRISVGTIVDLLVTFPISMKRVQIPLTIVIVTGFGTDSSMGCNVNAQINSENEYVQAVNTLASISQRRFLDLWMSLDPIFKLTSWGKKHDHALRVTHEFVNRIITERKAEWKAKRDGNFNERSHKRQALLDLLLEMSKDGKVLTDDDIRDEVNTFMFAGHDTTATSVSWILYALGRHPRYQEKILEEFYAVSGGKEISLDILSKLNWLEACIKETLRVYPVAPLIARQINHPITILGNEIPVGSTVVVNSFLLHRDARYFPDPETYKPERFLPDGPKYPSYTFVPFSAGSRNCIGWKYATMIVKVLILYILKEFHVESLDTEDQLRFVCELVLHNADGLRLKIAPRSRL